jgi:exonuclease VII small subunit
VPAVLSPLWKGIETVTTEIETTDETNAVAGEVITPESMLKENEQIIKRNWAKAEEKVGNVYRALTIIHTNELWKLHKDDKGKRKYTAFDQYLFGEFGWELSRVRALQIIKATRAKMIEAGELPASAAEPRKRTAPEVTAEKAAKVTSAQFGKALDAFKTRVDNIDAGDPDREEVVRIYNDAVDAIDVLIGDLDDLVARVAAQAETPAVATETDTTSEDDDDDDDNETDETN